VESKPGQTQTRNRYTGFQGGILRMTRREPWLASPLPRNLSGLMSSGISIVIDPQLIAYAYWSAVVGVNPKAIPRTLGTQRNKRAAVTRPPPDFTIAAARQLRLNRALHRARRATRVDIRQPQVLALIIKTNQSIDLQVLWIHVIRPQCQH